VVEDARRQVLAMAALMLASAGIDLWIFAAYLQNGGQLALAPIADGHVLAVAILILLLVLTPQRMLGLLPMRLPSRRPRPTDVRADTALIARLHELMTTTALYRDTGLDAPRLARRLGVPLRRVSEAINSQRSQNVSQFVNGYRVEEACRRLVASEEPITTIMLEAGFETKSNFNREFRRVTGMSPSEWRGKERARAG